MRWSRLKEGDIVDLIAPASGLKDKNDLEKIKEFIESLGLVPRIPNNIMLYKHELIEQNLDPFCANSDEVRFQHLKDAIYSEDSKLISPIRGGYGCSRLIEKLDKLPKPEKTKLFIGYSDMTALHLFFQNKWSWPTIHGRVLSQFINDPDAQSVQEIKSLIFGQKEVTYNNFKPLNNVALIEQKITAPITGGNLCLIENSIGTSWQIDAKDKIILIEEVDERGYRADRSFEHLLQSKILEGAKAIIVGEFTLGYEADGSSLIDYAIKRFVSKLQIPVIQSNDFGHGKVNSPLPFGTQCELHLGQNIILTCDTGVKEELFIDNNHHLILNNDLMT